MNTSTIINVLPVDTLFGRPLPVRGGQCCVDLRPSVIDNPTASAQAKVFAALADPSRLSVLGLLAAQTAPLCVCEVMTALPLSQPTISHHLKVLRDVGLVSSEKRGLWTYYAVVSARLGEVASFLSALSASRGQGVHKKGGETP